MSVAAIHFEVIWTIVSNVLVDVMDDFSLGERSSKQLLSNDAMLATVSGVSPNVDVAALVHPATAGPVGVLGCTLAT
jgi:hypothetical protein